MFYSLSRCYQRSSMLQAIRLSFNNTTFHLIMPMTPLNSHCKKRQTSLVPNSPDLNLMDYEVWGVVQQRVYECRTNSVDELKQRLVEVWNSLQQNGIHAAINEWVLCTRSYISSKI